MSKPLLIIGGGGHAKVLADALLGQGRDILGVIDANIVPGEDVFFGLKCIGSDEEVTKYNEKEILLVNGLGSLPGKRLRHDIFSRFKAKGYFFETIIHTSAYIAREVRLSEGVQVLAGATLGPGVEVGENTIINTMASVDHDCVIGRDCHISPGVTLSGHVSVNSNVHVSTGASVINGVEIGENCILGNGVSVNKSIDEGQIVYSAKFTCKKRSVNDK